MTTQSFTTRRQRSIGKEGEAAAGKFLRAKGLEILEHNYRTRWGELDIVAREKDTLVFVEVKTRSKKRFGGPLSAVTKEKQRRIRRMAEIYLLEKNIQNIPMRFDVVGIVMKEGNLPQIQWIVNAFGGL